MMVSNLTTLLKSYHDLSETHKKVMELLIIKFSDIAQLDAFSYLHKHSKLFFNDIEIIVKKLVKIKLVILEGGDYKVSRELLLELFPELIRKPDYIKVVKSEQGESKLYSFHPQTQQIRDYLYASFVEENPSTLRATSQLIEDSTRALLPFEMMLSNPIYDKALIHSPLLLRRFAQQIQNNRIKNLLNNDSLSEFFERNIPFKGLFNHIEIQKAEINFQHGNIIEAKAALKTFDSQDALILMSQIELFRGEFALSLANFEASRVTGKDGQKISRLDFNFYYEFFYWLNYVFNPEGLNKKKLESYITKVTKSREELDRFTLPLLYFLKKDRTLALEKLRTQINSELYKYKDVRLFFLFLMEYIITGDLSEKLKSFSSDLRIKLSSNGYLLFLREINYIMEKVGFKIPPIPTAIGQFRDNPVCLMSRITHQEKWEQMLDGLLNLVDEKSNSAKLDVITNRICYLINVEKGILQPLLQTMNAKGIWSSGRNISLKRLKEQQVEGMTDQDRHMAATIKSASSYYGSNDYYLNFESAIVELCGHPLLFLFSNPSISVELIKSQPEIITEKTGNDIQLKTNITDSSQKTIVVKETQTRFKLITLTPQQQTIIRMINQGITIPLKGKEKLLRTVSNLSGIMSVHTDMVDDSEASKTIDSDSRIRVQILPLGDGLKVELFVKPLDTEPPYVKPAKGGKVVYGTVDGEKCQTVRDLTAENANFNALNNDIVQYMDCNLIDEAVTFSDPYRCLDLLETINQHKDIAVVEWPEGERFRMKKSASFANLKLRVKRKGQWFELEGELTIDESMILSLKELLDLNRKSKGRFLELKNGEFLSLTEDLKKQVDELEAYVTNDKKGILINRFASHALEEIISKAASFKTDKHWRDFRNKIKETTEVEAEIPPTLDAELRSYQEEGFRWMTRLKAWDAGACLADDMGLGKTVQAIAMMLHLAENGPALVVCPASVVPNWGNELRKFAPTLNPIILKHSNREEIFNALGPFDVLVITYGLLQTEIERIAKIQWAMAVLDEAHAIKNTQTKSSKAAMSIVSDFKLALTGTPIQNHLGELWNLFNFCNPGLLGTLSQFNERFIKDDLQSQRNHLKKLIAPFILRRTKNKVLDELPSKTEITFSVELSDPEMAFYETLRREAIDTIQNNNGPNGHQHLQALAEITKLRLACCNTTLVNKAIQLPSAKMEAFFEIILELQANNHRALVFSQFVGHLAIVRSELDKQGISYQYLDGSTPIPQRELAVKAFQSGKGDLFLISLKAGGLGLNLTAADYVLHLDPWWNPAIEDQASDRAHRIGQTRPVTIYRLVAKNTIEEKILQLHATKRDMADNLLEGSDQSAKLSTADLLNLLREL
jgi:superfamily II DNA or RNA helicase